MEDFSARVRMLELDLRTARDEMRRLKEDTEAAQKMAGVLEIAKVRSRVYVGGGVVILMLVLVMLALWLLVSMLWLHYWPPTPLSIPPQPFREESEVQNTHELGKGLTRCVIAGVRARPSSIFSARKWNGRPRRWTTTGTGRDAINAKPTRYRDREWQR